MPQQINPFVIVRPGDHRSQHDKELEQARIRSHAAKVYHINRRAARAIQSLNIKHGAQCGHGNKIALCPVCKAITTGTHDKPSQYLGSGSSGDPFGTYPGHSAPALAHEVADYALEHGFSAVFAPLTGSATNSAKNSWKQCAIQLPTLFHAQLVGSIGWFLQNTSSRDYNAKKVLHRILSEQTQLALQALRKEIETITFVPTDSHLDAVGILSMLSWGPVISDEPYMISPTGQLQQLYAFSSFSTTSAHVDALYKLIGMRGGVEKIKLPYLRIIFELIDLMIATQTGQKPQFKLMSPKVETALGRPPIRATDDDNPLLVMKGISRELYNLVVQAAHLTEVVDLLHWNPRCGALKTPIIIARNEIQHGLLSLPTSQVSETDFLIGNELSGLTVEHYRSTLTEVIRLAVCIYSDLVLFPLAWIAGVKTRCAARMRSILELSHISNAIRRSGRLEHTRLYLWILWLGCLAATRSKHQGWFEAELLRLLSTMDTFEEEQLRGIPFAIVRDWLADFLWWAPVFDAPSKTLWTRLGAGSLLSDTTPGELQKETRLQG